MPESDTEKFLIWKIATIKKKIHGTGCKVFSVMAISGSRSQRGNKQYFNLGLMSPQFTYAMYNVIEFGNFF